MRSRTHELNNLKFSERNEKPTLFFGEKLKKYAVVPRKRNIEIFWENNLCFFS